MRGSTTSVLFLLILMLTASLGASADDFLSDLKKSIEGKTVTIRNFYVGKELEYDSAGELITKAAKGTWLADSGVRVKKVTLNRNTLELTGERLLQMYDPKGDLSAILEGQRVRIRMQLPIGADPNSVNIALHKIFYSSGEVRPIPAPSQIERSVDGRFTRCPGTIQYRDGGGPCMEPSQIDTPIQVGTMPDGSKVYIVTRAVKIPEIVRAPDPDYSEGARQQRIQGTCIFGVIVDQEGRISSMRVERPLAPDLDQNAARALKNWQFRPALLNGQPVPVRIHVEVNFRLY